MCITSSSLKRNGHLPLSVFLIIPFDCHAPVVATLFHFFLSFFLSLNIILYTFFYPKRSSFLGRELMSFSLRALLKYFVFQYYIYPSLSLLFLSSYTPFASSIQMLIHCDTEPKCPHTRIKIRDSTARRLLQYYQSLDKNFRDVSRVIWNFSLHFEIFVYLFHDLSRNPKQSSEGHWVGLSDGDTECCVW